MCTIHIIYRGGRGKGGGRGERGERGEGIGFYFSMNHMLVCHFRLHKWLRPGGRLLISDYCKGEGEGSSHFQEYVKQREYFLHTVKVHSVFRIHNRAGNTVVPPNLLYMKNLIYHFPTCCAYSIWMKIQGSFLSSFPLFHLHWAR